MGRVTVKLKLTNQSDLVLRQHRALKRTPRQVEIEALVDTGATRLYLKPSVIKALGLRKTGEVSSRTTNGDRLRNVYTPVRLDLMERNGNFDVVDIDEHVPNRLGQIPLEYLDLVVDPKAQTLRTNPAHGDKLMTEEY
jgi:predicted aspartyl protease